MPITREIEDYAIWFLSVCCLVDVVDTEGPPLGVLCLQPYITWCKEHNVSLKMPTGFERYAHSAVIISELFVNEQALANKEDDINTIFQVLLQHVVGQSLFEQSTDNEYGAFAMSLLTFVSRCLVYFLRGQHYVYRRLKESLAFALLWFAKSPLCLDWISEKKITFQKP